MMVVNQHIANAASTTATPAAIVDDNAGLPSYDDAVVATLTAQHEHLRYRAPLSDVLLDKRNAAAKYLEQEIHSVIRNQLLRAGKSRMMAVVVPVASSNSSDTDHRDDMFHLHHHHHQPGREDGLSLELREYDGADEVANVLWLEELDEKDGDTEYNTTRTNQSAALEAAGPASPPFSPLLQKSLWHQKDVIDLFLKKLKTRLEREGNTIYRGPAVEQRDTSLTSPTTTSKPPELKKPGWLGRNVFSSKTGKDIEITDLKLGWRSTASEASDYGVGMVPPGQVRVTAQWRDDVLFAQKTQLVNTLTRIGGLCVGIEIGTSV